jgi:hypothetical protein
VTTYVIIEKSGELTAEVKCGSSGYEVTLTVVFLTVLGMAISGILVVELTDSAAACSEDRRCISER